MPKSVFNADHRYLPSQQILSFAEMVQVASACVNLGVKKIRITGGEPLLRKNIEVLIAQLAQLRTPAGQPIDIALTTNGSLLAQKAASLKAAGLQRITISLDALDDATFKRMNDMNVPVAQVLQGIKAAEQAGFERIKINMVVQRGTNDHQIVPMAQHFKGSGHALRFIEYMDVGHTNGWRMQHVLPSHDVLAQLQPHFALTALPAQTQGETAQRWGHTDDTGQHAPHLGEIGLISSVSQAFCGDCSRLRLATDGKLYLCLFASQGHSLMPWLRSNDHSPNTPTIDLQTHIANMWHHRSDQYSMTRSNVATTPKSHTMQRIEMSYIGG
jgi:cyclic pyranopterin phosphate synthase